jgi:tetratricopeptide (TPR) repeat protein
MPTKTANPLLPELPELSALMRKGYKVLDPRHAAEACEPWLQAWELVKKVATPDMRKVEAFDAAYRGLHEQVFNWCQDLEQELGNAGLDNPAYYEHRLRYAREFLDRFPETDDSMYVNFRRAEGEALWALGRQSEAEAVYAALVEHLPDDAWGYIGWADQYWLLDSSPKEYAQAEGILQRALDRPQLTGRHDVLERLEGLYMQWKRPDRASEVRARLKQYVERESWPVSPTPPAPVPVSRVPVQKQDRPGRNDPCWCGSGKKYKRCHLLADEQQDRGT